MRSTSLKRIAYDPADHGGAMYVEFRGGRRGNHRVYRYDGIGDELFEQVRESGSPGRTFNSQVRDSFPFVRISPPPRFTPLPAEAQWQPVSSSMIARVAYSPESDGELYVEFAQSGAVYRYDDVGREEFDALVGAGSAGRHFLEQIRDRYPFERIDQLPLAEAA